MKTKKPKIDLVKIDYKKLKFTHTKIEEDFLKDQILLYPSFRNVFDIKRNYTQPLIKEIEKRIYGVIPKNIVLAIRGLQGSSKSTLAILIAVGTFPNFDVRKHLAFTNEELLDKILKYSEKKAFFIRDENPYSLRHRSQLELDAVMETNREFQLSFCIVGVGEIIPDSTHFILESVDMDEKNMVSRFAIKDQKTRTYRGAFLVALPKEKKHKFWQQWKIYMKMKKEFQEKIRERNTEGFNPTEVAMEFVRNPIFKECFHTTKSGAIKLNKSKLKVELFKKYANYTNEERAMIQTEVIIIASTGMETFTTLSEVKEDSDKSMKADLKERSVKRKTNSKRKKGKKH